MAQQSAEFKKGTYYFMADGVKWAVKFNDGGKLTLATDDEVVVVGSYKVTGDEIEVTDEKGPRACMGEQKTGRYKWNLDGKKLTFSKIEDECEGRVKAISSKTWMQE